jgi:hypothetical protein
MKNKMFNKANLKQDILILILTTESYFERRKSIRDTWGKKCNIIFYSDHEDTDTIKICESTDNFNVVLKTQNIIKFLQKYNDLNKYKWLFFVDDDTYINTYSLENKLNIFNDKVVYGRIDPIPEIDGSYKEDFVMHGGAGILMSPQIIKNIKDFNWNNKIQAGDYVMTEYLRNNKEILIDYPLFFSKEIDLINDNYAPVYEKITYHHVSPENMYLTHNIIEKAHDIFCS